jgi:hypothetical protein
MVQEAEALEKPGKPTFFETPAWSFNIEWVLWGDGGSVGHGGGDFFAAMRCPEYR